MKTDDKIFTPKWPDGLKPNTIYRFTCDDCCPSEETKDLTVVISDDGDVWLRMIQVEDKKSDKPHYVPFPSVRCRTGIGGGRHRRTRQALLWLARAIQLDNEELGIENS